MGGIGDIVGGVVGTGAELGMSFLNNRMNNANRHDAQDWEGMMFANRYQMQVQDLMRAGLNPMLAYGTGPGSTPGSSAQGLQRPDVTGAFNSTRAVTAQVANTQQDTLKKAAEARNIDTDTLVKSGMVEQVAAMTASSMASAEQATAMAEQIRVSIPKIEAEIQNIKTQIDKNKSDVQLNDSLIKANAYLNSLRLAETTLHGQQITLQGPKVKAYENAKANKNDALGSTAAMGDVMQNFWRMVNPFHSTFTGGK